MQTTYDVYGIGNALVDLEFKIDDSFLEAHGVKKGLMTLVDKEKQTELINASNQTDADQKPGGSAANTMMAVSQLGGRAFYSCKVANDAHGDFYIDDMHQSGIDTNYPQKNREDGITGKCMVMITPDAERTMNTYLGITADLSVREVNEEAIKKSEYVYIEGYLIASDNGFEAMKRTQQLAADHDVKIAITLSDPSIIENFKKRFQELIENGVNLLFCNQEEAHIFTGEDDYEQTIETLRKAAPQFIITKGSEGSVVYDGQQLINITPQSVEAIDTNGAGDMYAGTFLYGITNGMTHEQAGKLAGRTSAEVVTQYGPRLPKEKMKQLMIQTA